MYKYRLSTPEKIFNKCENKIINICKKLCYQTNCGRRHTVDSIMQEARIKFFDNFAEYYENQEQYLRFLFISLKHHIINWQKKDTRNKHLFNIVDNSLKDEDPYMDSNQRLISGLRDISGEDENINYVKKRSSEFCANELLEQLEDELDKMIVVCITSGKNVFQTSRELQITSSVVNERLQTNILSKITNHTIDKVIDYDTSWVDIGEAQRKFDDEVNNLVANSQVYDSYVEYLIDQCKN